MADKITYKEAMTAHQKWIGLMDSDSPSAELLHMLKRRNHFALDSDTAITIRDNCKDNGNADLHIYFGVQENAGFIAFILDGKSDSFRIQFDQEKDSFYCFKMSEGRPVPFDNILLNDVMTRVFRWQQMHESWLGATSLATGDQNKFYCISFPFQSFNEIVAANESSKNNLRFYLGMKPTREVADYGEFEVELLFTNAQYDSGGEFGSQLELHDFSGIVTFERKYFTIPTNDEGGEYMVANVSTPIPPYPPQFQLNENAQT